jgi:lipopolysaccharide export system protein LptA
MMIRTILPRSKTLSLLTATAMTLAAMMPWGAQAVAQGAGQELAFGSTRPSADTPVSVAADSLSVNQADGTAIFSGNVVIEQGDMMLSAANVRVVYKEDSQKIASLKATGGVTLASGPDAAEAQAADYNIDTGLVVLTGKVLLAQGDNVITGEKVTINLTTGTATAGGRVRTTLQTGN